MITQAQGTLASFVCACGLRETETVRVPRQRRQRLSESPRGPSQHEWQKHFRPAPTRPEGAQQAAALRVVGLSADLDDVRLARKRARVLRPTCL